MTRKSPKFPVVVFLLSFPCAIFGQQWTTNNSLPTGLGFTALSPWNGFLYQTGGVSSNGYASGTNVNYAQALADGTIGPWKSGPALPVAVSSHATVTARGFLYVLGGAEYTTPPVPRAAAQVFYSQISPDGSLGPWQTNTPLPAALQSEAACVRNNNIYVVGGYSGVYSATVNVDGTLGPWTSRNVVAGLNSPAGCVANGTVYILGSGGGSGEVYGNTVYYSTINADGSLNAWNQTTPLVKPLGTTGAVAANGFVFYVGGLANGNIASQFAVQDACYSAQIAGDSTLGAWSTQPSLPQPLYGFGSAIIGSNIFTAGGVSFITNTNGTLHMVYHPDVYSLQLPPPPPQPILTAQGIDTNGGFQVQLSSVANTGFGILASSDLTNWTRAGWNFTDTNGLLLFTDTNATSVSARFYRAYWPLP